MSRLTCITLIIVLCSCVPEMRTSTITPAVVPLSEWSVPGHRDGHAIYAGDLVIGYADGYLIANRVSDGTEAWRRHPDIPVLGVTYKGETQDFGGIPIYVVPGSSAAAAGLETKDDLLSFNGHETRNFARDIRQAVIAMKPGDPFTATVRRGSRTLTLMGIMGGEPVEPSQPNRTSVIVWPRGVIGKLGQDLPISVHDLLSGQRLLHFQSTPDRNDRKSGFALLTPRDILIAVDAGDLIGLPVRGNVNPDQVHPLWRLPLPIGISDATEQVHLLSDDLLWAPDSMEHHVAIVEISTGHARVVLPIDPTSVALMAGPRVLSLSDDGVITCWDIATGNKSWQSGKECSRLIAAHNDSVYACDKDHHLVILDLASGIVHRKYGEWTVFGDSVANKDWLGLHVIAPSRAQILISITASSGNVQWQHELPMGTKVGVLVTPPDAFGCVLVDDQNKEILLLMANDGKVRHFCSLVTNEQVIPAPGRAIAAGPNGLRVLPIGPSETHSQ